jgi:hypothetical protein
MDFQPRKHHATNEMTPLAFCGSPSTMPTSSSASRKRTVEQKPDAFQRSSACTDDNPATFTGNGVHGTTRNHNVESDSAASEQEHPFFASHFRRIDEPQHEERETGKRIVAQQTQATRAPSHRARAVGRGTDGTDAASCLSLTDSSPFAVATRGTFDRVVPNAQKRPVAAGTRKGEARALRQRLTLFVTLRQGGIGGLWVKLVRGQFLPNGPPAHESEHKHTALAPAALREQLEVLTQSVIDAELFEAIVGDDDIKHVDFVRCFGEDC